MSKVTQLLDVTLRDGGFCNGFKLSADEVAHVVGALQHSAADIVEIGYVGGLPQDHGSFPNAGPTFHLPLRLLRELTAKAERPCAVMMHPRGPHQVDLQELANTGISWVRVPIRPATPDADIKFLGEIAQTGLCVSANLILGSWWKKNDAVEAAKKAKDSGAGMVFVADTTSALQPSTVGAMFSALAEAISLPVGFHAHNGKGLAMANTLTAIEHGAAIVDASVFGIGREAGNTPMEVLVEATRSPDELLRQLEASLPILRVYELMDEESVWLRVCAVLDLSPPCSVRLDHQARLFGMHRLEAGIRLATRLPQRVRPLSDEACRAFLASEPAKPLISVTP